MSGRWSSIQRKLLELSIWASIALVAALWLHFPVSHAGDDMAAENSEMQKQLEAYQSPYHLVKAVQKRLDAWGYCPGPIDGILGPKTRAALMAFQKDNDLRVDGLIGIETLRRLDLIRTGN